MKDAAATALDQLVNQFSDPLSFYRELIQNAIDAGSAEVEVRLEHTDGVMVIHVDDFGEGMTREIIDSRLTRLFSSRKDGDLTKIGKFGIGFVSVFAIEPEAVVVDTSREGEHWRVLFTADRSFERRRRSTPVDGTKIRILKTASNDEYQDFVRRSEEVVTYWCRYVEAEVRFQGRPVNRDFALASPCQLRYREQGTEIVVGYPADLEPRFGFYNRGLTLLEGNAAAGERASMMVNSRFLEHTLARDDVRRDENYFKVMRVVDRLVAEDLPEKLRQMIEVEVAREKPSPRRATLFRILARCLEPQLSWVFPAVEMHHGGGHQEGDEWVATPGTDDVDTTAHLIFGPYTREIPAGSFRATWRLSFDWHQRPRGSKVATLEVHDAEADKVIAERTLRRRHLEEPGEPMAVSLGFKASGKSRLEFRTLWHRNIELRQSEVRVSGGETPDAERSPFRNLQLFTDCDGRPLSLGRVARASRRGRLLTAPAGSRLGRALKAAGWLVIVVDEGSRLRPVLSAIGAAPPEAHRQYCLPQAVAVPKQGGWLALAAALGKLIELHFSDREARVSLARLEDHGPAADPWVAVAQQQPFTLDELAEVRELGRGRRARSLVVNVGHPTVQHLLELARTEPELAAYLLLKLFNLRRSAPAAEDADLAGIAWQQRRERMAGHGG